MGKGSNGRGESLKASIARWNNDLMEYKANLLGQVNAKIKSIGDVVDRNANSLKGFVLSMTQQISTTNANIGVQQQAIEQLDIRGQIHGRLLLQAWGKLQQMDHFLQELGISPGELDAADTQRLRDTAKENFESSYSGAASWVLEFREAQMKENRRQADEAAKAAEAAAAEKELVEAEQPNLVSEAGGQGAEPPEGADIFGG